MIKLKRSSILAAVLGFTLALSGCGGGGSTAEQPNEPPTTPEQGQGASGEKLLKSQICA